MKMSELLAILMLEESNMRCLHWNCAGKHFRNTHETTSEYYDMISEDLDWVAEASDRMGEGTLNILEAIGVVREIDKEIFIVDSKKDYDEADEVYGIISTILTELLESIALVLQSSEIAEDITNVGIKSVLEGMYEKYDKQLRFITKRKML